MLYLIKNLIRYLLSIFYLPKIVAQTTILIEIIRANKREFSNATKKKNKNKITLFFLLHYKLVAVSLFIKVNQK